jgi:hypothetical protein
MNNNIKIIPGCTYLTKDGIAYTALRETIPGRALFVSEEFCPTPFVCAIYTVINTNEIELFCNTLYPTIESALQAECNEMEFMRLKVILYCPDCETNHEHVFPVHTSVQDIMERIEDTRLVCPHCDETFMGVRDVVLIDRDTEYELPIWRGPLPDYPFIP